MPKKILLLVIFFMLLSVCAVFAQEQEEEESPKPKSGGDFWLGVGADTGFYSVSGLSWGGSFTLGYGTGSSIGLKVTWFFSPDDLGTVEINLLLRFYLLGASAYSGPYLQIMGGPSLFYRSGEFSVPSDFGIVSAGVGFGWRFLFLNRWFVEPAVRGGFPYLIGAGVSAGVRF